MIKTLSENLTRLRRQNECSRSAFAAKLGISATAMINYEHGRRLPNAQFIKRVCCDFAVSADWLLFGSKAQALEGKPDSENGYSLGRRIRELRNNQSQAAFATLIGISQSALGTYELDRRSPDAHVIESICQRCQVTADWLVLGLQDGSQRAAGRPATVAGISDHLARNQLKTLTSAPKPACNVAGLDPTTYPGLLSEYHELNRAYRELSAKNQALLEENGDLRLEVERLRVHLKGKS